MRTWIFLLCAAAALHAQSVAGLRWTAPAGWKAEGGSRPMRAATYNLPPVAGDHDPAECVVYFFGQGQGGSVEANIERWKSQFHAPGGKPVDARVGKRTVHGLAVTTIDTSGEYSGMGGPLAKETALKPTYRLLGAIVENPGGNLFIKFTGEAKTVAANQQKFEQFLASFEADKH
jgi:hypothetical protein